MDSPRRSEPDSYEEALHEEALHSLARKRDYKIARRTGKIWLEWPANRVDKLDPLFDEYLPPFNAPSVLEEPGSIATLIRPYDNFDFLVHCEIDKQEQEQVVLRPCRRAGRFSVRAREDCPKARVQCEMRVFRVERYYLYHSTRKECMALYRLLLAAP